MGRYSIIGLPCRNVIRVRGSVVTVEADSEVIEEHRCEDPFEFVNEFKSRFHVAPTPGDQRFAGGLVGYFSYDTVRYVETSMGAAKGTDDIGTPDILLMVSEEVVVFDNLRGTISFVIHVIRMRPEPSMRRRLAWMSCRPAPQAGTVSRSV